MYKCDENHWSKPGVKKVFGKGQRVNISCSVGHMGSVATTLLRCCGMQLATDAT